MPDYSKAKIYKIYSYENDDVYYGSTCETLSQRMTRHRSYLKSYKEGKGKYITSIQILEFESAKIELVENYPCNSKEELLQREGYYIRNNNCVNKYIPDRTKKEYNKAYREANNEKYTEYQKIYMREKRALKKEQLLMLNEDTNINK